MATSNGIPSKQASDQQDDDLMELTLQLRDRKQMDAKYAKFRGDGLLADPVVPKVGLLGDLVDVFQVKNWPSLKRTFDGIIKGTGIDGESLATIAGSLSDYSVNRQNLINDQVKEKYDKMLHPPLTYLGDAFQYRTADGKFNSVINPHLGQAGAPYARTVPSQSAPLGALPDPSDIFDKLMAREEGGRQSKSGLSSMLIYHATIIIHDIFRTNDDDKNISDSSSYLDLSPLYGYTTEMQRKVRDDKYMLGLLKPDTFAEDRLLRQPPGVCIMLVMYNRYHNYAARQLARINENGQFSIPKKFAKTKLVSLVNAFASPLDKISREKCDDYETTWRAWQAKKPDGDDETKFEEYDVYRHLMDLTQSLELLIQHVDPSDRAAFEAGYAAAWTKLDDDLFNTARLITCGMYIQISVHDYLRALMGFHQFDTNFTLDPRADFDQKKTSRGIGNQVTVEFNLLYRFHCAISLRDEKYTEEYMKKELGFEDPRNTSLPQFLRKMAELKAKLEEAEKQGYKPPEPWQVEFGISDPKGVETPEKKSQQFKRNPITNLFSDQQMLDALTAAMEEPISNFGPRNTPQCLKAVEILGITQARKWEVGTLNDFRDFFGMSRHESFESVTENVEIQNALRDLYEHPDKIELYPGIFCESDQRMGLDPGPAQANSALWTAIFSDAITLVRSDRFYTVDWNTNSLTSWGMKEVTPDNEICKSSVFHRLLQRAFPGWYDYNTIRFFHPFYTAEQNAIYAKAQGYGPQFKETVIPEFDLVVPPPKKPQKPIFLEKYADIVEVLKDKCDNFMNPALFRRENLPKAMADVLDPDQDEPTLSAKFLDDHVKTVEVELKGYLDDLMRYIVRRESVAMTTSQFQIDTTRDFGIAVVTRYVAEFLGFGSKLRTDSKSSTANTYTEDEIYQHITNCQIFLTFNPDETKQMKRRNAFKASLSFLMGLTERGNIYKATQWGITKTLFGEKNKNAMSDLGIFVAKKVLEYEKDPTKASAILLLVCLDFAYDSVVSFTAVLDAYMKELYSTANLPVDPTATEPKWITIQRLAFDNTPDGNTQLEGIIRSTSLATVRLPIVRKAIKDQVCKFGKVQAEQTVIISLTKATEEAEQNQHPEDGDELDFLTSQLSIADKYGVFRPRRFSTVALTSMVKFIAQMKNPRRGHDAQGKLKRVRLDTTSEGYANYMAPMRVRRIMEQVAQLSPKDHNKGVFTPKVLVPATDTYLTPTWDEMVPFPMTWKIRFDGFGRSDYSKDSHPYGLLTTVTLPDDTPPFYQPRGPSHTGGTFAGVVCICAAAQADQLSNGLANGTVSNGWADEHEQHCPCLGQSKALQLDLKTSLLSTGCGMGHAGGPQS